METSPDCVLLTTAYFPPVEYFILVAAYGRALIERHENYTKQSYRNRCNILSANGLLSLTIPVKRYRGIKTPIIDVKPDNSYNWQKLHRISIESAYRSAPFYEFYIDDIMPFLESEYNSLFRLNTDILNKTLEVLDINALCNHTENFTKIPPAGCADKRDAIHPKRKDPDLMNAIEQLQYTQVFQNRWGFVPGLSILDLLFNAGPDSGRLLEKAALTIRQ